MARHPQLPTARLISNEPTDAQVRWVMRLVWLAMISYVAIMVFGHIPKG